MRALTLWPEWAALVAIGVKDVEIRGERPPSGMIGQRFAVHAGASVGGKAGPAGIRAAGGVVALAGQKAGRDVGVFHTAEGATLGVWDAPYDADVDPGGEPPDLELVIPTSALVALATLGEPRRPSKARRPSWERSALPSEWVWPLLDVVRLDPIPVKRGQLGFWSIGALAEGLLRLQGAR